MIVVVVVNLFVLLFVGMLFGVKLVYIVVVIIGDNGLLCWMMMIDMVRCEIVVVLVVVL